MTDDLLWAVLANPHHLDRRDGRAYLDGQDVTPTVVWALTCGLIEAGVGGLVSTAAGATMAGVVAGVAPVPAGLDRP